LLAPGTCSVAAARRESLGWGVKAPLGGA